MHSAWRVPGRPSGVNPAFASGEPPPLLPPDPTSPLSPVNFPTLSSTGSVHSRKGSRRESRNTVVPATTGAEKHQTGTTISDSPMSEIGNDTPTVSVTVPASGSGDTIYLAMDINNVCDFEL